jgi:hypothetical protein
LLSSWDKGMEEVALPKVYGTAMLKPHSQFVFVFKTVNDNPRIFRCYCHAKILAVLFCVCFIQSVAATAAKPSDYCRAIVDPRNCHAEIVNPMN